LLKDDPGIEQKFLQKGGIKNLYKTNVLFENRLANIKPYYLKTRTFAKQYKTVMTKEHKHAANIKK